MFSIHVETYKGREPFGHWQSAEFFILHIWLYASIELRMAKMSLSSYILMLTFSLFSQGILLSASKSIRNVEDDMVFNTFRMGKAFQKEDTAERSVAAPSLEQYKNDDSSFMNDEENKNSKVSTSSLTFITIAMKTAFIVINNLKGNLVFSFCKWEYMQTESHSVC